MGFVRPRSSPPHGAAELPAKLPADVRRMAAVMTLASVAP